MDFMSHWNKVGETSNLPKPKGTKKVCYVISNFDKLFFLIHKLIVNV